MKPTPNRINPEGWVSSKRGNSLDRFIVSIENNRVSFTAPPTIGTFISSGGESKLKKVLKVI